MSSRRSLKLHSASALDVEVVAEAACASSTTASAAACTVTENTEKERSERISGVPPTPAEVPPTPIQSIAVREVLGLQARFTPALPLSTTLLCQRGPLTADPTPLCITTSRAAYVVARERGWDVLVGGELAALVVAVEHDRAGPGELAQWCARKRADQQWRLTYEVAVGLAAEPLVTRGWSVGRVLAVLGLELLGVGAADEVPAP